MSMIKTVSGKKLKYLCNMTIIALFVILLFVVGVTDETKDDLSVQMFISACDGAPTYMHNWESPLWIIPLYYLQQLVPNIALHYCVQVLILFISILIICNAIIEKFPMVYGYLMALLTSIILFYQSVSTLNFTRTAILAVVSGLILLFSRKRYSNWGASILIIIGSILRFDVLYISVGFIVLICFYKLVAGEKHESVKNIVTQYVLPLLVIFMVAFGLQGVNAWLIESNETWNAYVVRNELISDIMDYSLAGYSENETGYLSLGITENDYKMLYTRMASSDSEFFSDELMNIIKDNYSGKWQLDLSWNAIYNWLKDCGRYTIKCYFSWFILAGMLASFLGLLKPKKWWLPILTGCCMVAYMMFFGIMGRIVDRVFFGVFLCAGMTMLICLTGDEFSVEKGKKKTTIIAAVFSVIVVGITIILGNVEKRVINENIAEVFDYMEEHEDNFFGYTRYSISEVQGIENLLDVNTYWNTGNSMYLTQLDNSPNERQKLDAYGIDNIYKNSVDSEMIRFIDSKYIHRIEAYIKQHYNADARAELVDTLGEYSIYRIVTD